MALPPMLNVTLQSSVIGAVSNILAQFITSQQNNTPFTINWVPVFQFFLYAVVSTPPNFLWQQYLEETFPATHPAPTTAAIKAAAAGDDKALDSVPAPSLVEPKLNVRNTVIKTLLDQTVGAAVNTAMYSMFMHPLRVAMAHHSPGYDFMFGGSGNGKVVDYSAVDWNHAVATSKAEFLPLIKASWAFWPFVSVLNFAVIKDVATRSLVGNLAGVAWGVYVSLFA
ncbi:Mpv17/PMP22 family protein [Coniochaeta sp. 2T2.1]|nr:Mpv17/PMP22 family protein [Coniochaeta sp. 2T2.1]